MTLYSIINISIFTHKTCKLAEMCFKFLESNYRELK